MWCKKPLPLSLLSSPQTLSQKHYLTSIHIFLDAELHTLIPYLYPIFFSIVKKKAAHHMESLFRLRNPRLL